MQLDTSGDLPGEAHISAYMDYFILFFIFWVESAYADLKLQVALLDKILFGPTK